MQDSIETPQEATEKSFWVSLKEDFQVDVPIHLRFTLDLMGFGSPHAAKKLVSSDVEKIETFMRSKWLAILRKRHSNDANKLNDEIEKYYGPVWSMMPEEFEIMAGERYFLDSVVTAAEKLSSGRASSKLFSRSSAQSHSPAQVKAASTSKTNSDLILAQKSEISATLINWLKKNAAALVDLDSPDFSLGVEVLEHMGRYTCTVACPVPECKHDDFTFSKVHGRWTTSNFHRHVSSHILQSVKSLSQSKQQPKLMDMFGKSQSKSNPAPSCSKSSGIRVAVSNSGNIVDADIIVHSPAVHELQRGEDSDSDDVIPRKKINTGRAVIDYDSSDSERDSAVTNEENFGDMGKML